MLQRTPILRCNTNCRVTANHHLALTYVAYRRGLAAAWKADTQLTHGSRGNPRGHSHKRKSVSSGHDLTVRR